STRGGPVPAPPPDAAAPAPDDGRPRRSVKAWGDLPGDDPERDRAEKQAAIAEAGLDLDPTPPGVHRPGGPPPRPAPPGLPPPRRRHPPQRPCPPARPLGAGRHPGHRDRRRRG